MDGEVEFNVPLVS